MSASDSPLFKDTSAPILARDISLNGSANVEVILLSFNVALILFMLVILLARLYARRNLLHNLGWDDYTCTLAATGSVVNLVLIILSFWVRFGRDSNEAYWTFLLDPLYIRLNSATQIIYPLVIYTVKLSILLLYKRVFTIGKVLNITINAGIIVMALLYAMFSGFGIVLFIQCVDVDSLNQTSVCGNVYSIILAEDIVNLVTDVFVLVLPFKAIRKLQLKRRQKLGVIAIFSAGLIPCLLSLLRCTLLIGIWKAGILFWSNTLLRYAAEGEINIAIIVACTFILPSFLAHIKQSIRKRQRGSVTRASWRAEINQPGTIELSESKQELRSHTKSIFQTTSMELNLQDQYPSNDGKKSLGK